MKYIFLLLCAMGTICCMQQSGEIVRRKPEQFQIPPLLSSSLPPMYLHVPPAAPVQSVRIVETPQHPQQADLPLCLPLLDRAVLFVASLCSMGGE